MLGLLPQFNDTNASMDLEQNGGGGLPGEGYLKFVPAKATNVRSLKKKKQIVGITEVKLLFPKTVSQPRKNTR